MAKNDNGKVLLFFAALLLLPLLFGRHRQNGPVVMASEMFDSVQVESLKQK